MKEDTLSSQEKTISVAVTGASGAPYALKLIKALAQSYDKIYLMISAPARQVFATECGLSLPEAVHTQRIRLSEYLSIDEQKLDVLSKENWMSPVASGSSAPKQMVVCPCSMGTLSAIAHGASDNLIERAADVVIKEKGQLILVPRESPFSVIHLENMLSLARLGVTIMPACPGYYHQPEKIEDLVDFMVARILDHLGAAQSLVGKWGYAQEKSV